VEISGIRASRCLTGRLDIDLGDLRLHAAISGSGHPLMLLHGFTGSVETWAPLRPDLEREYRVIAVDLPGHGRSSSPPDPGRYSLRRVASDLVDVMDEIGIDRATVIGYSMGGRAALHLAAAHPDRVAGLILESASAGSSDPELRKARADSDEELAGFIEREGVAAFVDRWERLPLWESQKNLPASVRTALREQRLSNTAAGLANSLRGAGAAADPLSEGALARINAATLLIAGALDPKYVGIARQLADSIPHARVAVIPDAGHAVHLERPRAMLGTVHEFLNSHVPVRADTPRV
jgi:2-succinyl-6-hydroxy-2,4-cyclohexadiene-1-carboxylate synthase